MSNLKQRTLSFVSEPNVEIYNNDDEPVSKKIKEIRKKIKENRRINDNLTNSRSNISILPQEGYLFSSKLDISNSNELNKTIRAIRGNREMKFIPSETYILYDEMIRIKNEEKRRRHKLDDDDFKLIGDPIAISKSWPNKSERIRITFHNVGGMNTDDNIFEGHLFNQDLIRIQSDITCFTELNVNLNNNNIKNEVRNIFKLSDRHAKIFMAMQPEKQMKHYGYLPGGNVIAINGTLSGRVISGESDP